MRFARHLLSRAQPWLSQPLNFLFIGTSVAAFYYVLLLQGFTPGLDQAPDMALYGAGMIQCLHDQGLSSLTQWCHAVGYPVGAPLLTGLPQIYVGWLFSYVPRVDVWAANRGSFAFYDGLAMVGGFLLMRRWAAGRWVALFASVLYLTSMSILRLTGLSYAFTGYILLPFYLAAGIFLMDRFVRGGRWRPAIGMVALTLLMVFTDGYSFFSAALLLFLTAFLRLVAKRFSSAGAWWAMTVLAASIIVSAIVYTVYVPGAAYEQKAAGLGVFRFLGLDLATLVIPVNTLWYPNVLGMNTPTLPLWGDGTNASNYIGFSTLALSLWLIIVGRRRLTRTTRVEVWALFTAGVVALILSFGPALKIYDVARHLPSAYDLPASMTTLPLPTAWLYEHVPGLTEMRATYRWFLVTRLATIFTACLALSVIWRVPAAGTLQGPSTVGSYSSSTQSEKPPSRTRGLRTAATVLVAILLALETVVDIPNQLQVGKSYAQKVDKIRNGVVAEAGTLLRNHERVLVVPAGNDFLADVVIPMAGAVSYNAGGDKNSALARAAWPMRVEGAARSYGSANEKRAYCMALRGDVHAIVLPYISFHFGSLMTGDRSAEDRAMKQHASAIAGDVRFTSDSGTWMTVLRSSGMPC